MSRTPYMKLYVYHQKPSAVMEQSITSNHPPDVEAIPPHMPPIRHGDEFLNLRRSRRTTVTMWRRRRPGSVLSGPPRTV